MGIPAFGAALGQELAAVGGGDRIPEGAVGREGRAFAFYGAEAEAGFPDRDVAAVFVDRGDHLIGPAVGQVGREADAEGGVGAGVGDLAPQREGGEGRFFADGRFGSVSAEDWAAAT